MHHVAQRSIHGRQVLQSRDASGISQGSSHRAGARLPRPAQSKFGHCLVVFYHLGCRLQLVQLGVVPPGVGLRQGGGGQGGQGQPPAAAVSAVNHGGHSLALGGHVAASELWWQVVAVCVVVALCAHVGVALLQGVEPGLHCGPAPLTAHVEALVVGQGRRHALHHGHEGDVHQAQLRSQEEGAPGCAQLRVDGIQHRLHPAPAPHMVPAAAQPVEPVAEELAL
mmetsp:Transcript_12266/g.26458  ORF Transcript_12266/g.26458 Transcript_12266/m.26458 type:complete len:224 (-) Transcript_12266:753-1424(-)